MTHRILAGGLTGLAGIVALSSCTDSEAASPAPVAADAESATMAEPGSSPNPALQPVPVADVMTYDGELIQGGYIRGKVAASTQSLTLNGKQVELSPAREFFVAFDRDADRNVALVQTFRNGLQNTEELEVSSREWNIQRVNVAKRASGSSEAWWKKREPEWMAIRDARAKETGAEGWKQDFIWPVKGRISGHFGRQRIYRGEPGSYHSGIDIAPGGGKPFVAPADGVVVLARTGFSLEGGIIILDHGAGLNSAFIHLSKLAVDEGDAVKQGQYIGNVGATGRATGPHLHWSLKWNDSRLDPYLFVGPMN